MFIIMKVNPLKLHVLLWISPKCLQKKHLEKTKRNLQKHFKLNLMGMIMLDSERKVIEANDVVYKL